MKNILIYCFLILLFFISSPIQASVQTRHVSDFSGWNDYQYEGINSSYTVMNDTVLVTGNGCGSQVWHQFTNIYENSIGISGVLNVNSMAGCSQIGFRQFYDATDGGSYHYHFNIQYCGNTPKLNLFIQKIDSNGNQTMREDWDFNQFQVIGTDIKLSMFLHDNKMWFYCNDIFLQTIDIPSDTIQTNKRRDLKLWIAEGCDSSVSAMWKSIDVINSFNPCPKGQPWLQLLLLNSSSSHPPTDCGAYIAPGVWQEFDCYNLAAIGKTSNDDPFTPSWRLIGGYWQWGKKGPDPSQWYDTNTPNFAHGPTGSDLAEANSDAISGWDQEPAPNGSWSDASKTSNDPCPAGYRVPTQSQWGGVIDNNIQSVVGTWLESVTNYNSGRSFGDDLMLPAAADRNYGNGSLGTRNGWGDYWSSTEDSGSNNAWRLNFTSSYASANDYGYRRHGFSVRCIKD